MAATKKDAGEMKPNRLVVWGKAVLELHPWCWDNNPHSDLEQAVAVLRALWQASEHIISVSLSHGGTVLVELTIPVESPPDLNGIQCHLQDLATSAVLQYRNTLEK